LNPVYKTTYIPSTKPSQCISGPLEKIGLLVSLEDSLYGLERKLYSGEVAPVVKPIDLEPVPVDSLDSLGNSTLPALGSYIYHKVKSGETMGTIATKYGVTVEQIMEWNALRTTNIYVGQRLQLKSGPGGVSQQNDVPKVEPPKPVKKYYSVKSGDTFSKVASRHGLTQAQLTKLNPGININRLTVGQRLRVK